LFKKTWITDAKFTIPRDGLTLTPNEHLAAAYPSNKDQFKPLIKEFVFLEREINQPLKQRVSSGSGKGILFADLYTRRSRPVVKYIL
jgi:hypothetical protein